MGRAAICETCNADFWARNGRAGRFCSRDCFTEEKRRRLGGVMFDVTAGRWIILCRDGTKLWYYRGVMAAQIGRLLRPEELVHHLNGDSTDDRPENLVVMSRAEHHSLHSLKRWEAGGDLRERRAHVS